MYLIPSKFLHVTQSFLYQVHQVPDKVPWHFDTSVHVSIEGVIDETSTAGRSDPHVLSKLLAKSSQTSILGVTRAVFSQVSGPLVSPPWHHHPGSSRQFESQPSPSIRLLCSHSSYPTLQVSPQISSQLLGSAVSQSHPLSTNATSHPFGVVRRSHPGIFCSEHPSRVTVFPSSQVSLPTTRPSPQISKQTSLVVVEPNLQSHPAS